MKKIYIIVFLAVFAFGCESHLDQNPSSMLPREQAITTVNDLNNAVNGALQTLISHASGRYSVLGDWSLYGDCKGGDVIYIDDNNHLKNNIIFQTDPNSGEAEDYFAAFYITIARCNDVLTALDNITDKDMHLDQYNDLVAQLQATKAYCHFELARAFCQIPVVAADVNAEKSGIIINDKFVDATVKNDFKRSTLKETYDYVITKFTEALPNLSKENNLGKINYWAALALRARAYLYMGDYNNALKDAIDVIKNSGRSIIKRAEYLSVWGTEGASSFLFEILADDQFSAQRESLGYYCDPAGYAECAASNEFVDFMNVERFIYEEPIPKYPTPDGYTYEDLGDIRNKSVTFQYYDGDKNGEYNNDKDGSEGYYTIKYKGRDGTTSPLYCNNAKVIRVEELYYIAAESILKGGTATGAESADFYLNEILKERISPDKYTPVTNITIDDILDDKRKEFFCEGHRMFDLVRNKKSWKHPYFVDLIEWNDYRNLVAIPQREIEIHKFKQNQGY